MLKNLKDLKIRRHHGAGMPETLQGYLDYKKTPPRRTLQ
jgi:hypothetical protein